MSELNTDTVGVPLQEAATKSSCITSSGAIAEPSLSHLREQIKNAMIPLLIKVFHLRLEVQQASSPPSRLHNKQPKAPLDDLIIQLQKLDEDLKLLQVWSQSCRNQVHKVLQEAQEDTTSTSSNQFHPNSSTHPAVQKSFTDAVTSQQEKMKSSKALHGQQKEPTSVGPSSNPIENEEQHSQPKWWHKIIGK